MYQIDDGLENLQTLQKGMKYSVVPTKSGYLAISLPYGLNTYYDWLKIDQQVLIINRWHLLVSETQQLFIYKKKNIYIIQLQHHKNKTKGNTITPDLLLNSRVVNMVRSRINMGENKTLSM